MPLTPISHSQALRVIHASLSPVWVFRHPPGSPELLADPIVWADILAIPPVTRSWLYNQTLIAAFLLDRDRFRPRMNRRVFFAHLANGADRPGQETVAEYRDFLVGELILKVAA